MGRSAATIEADLRPRGDGPMGNPGDRHGWPEAGPLVLDRGQRAAAEAWIRQLGRSRGFGSRTLQGLLDAIDDPAVSLPGRQRNAVIRTAYMRGLVQYPHGNPRRGETVAGWICRMAAAVACPSCDGLGWIRREDAGQAS